MGIRYMHLETAWRPGQLRALLGDACIGVKSDLLESGVAN